MHQKIGVKFEIIMILMILLIGCTTSNSSTDRSTTQRQRIRIRHHRSIRTNRSSNSNNATIQELEDAFSRNVALVNSPEWRCGTPKPRLVYLHEALQEVQPIPPYKRWIVNAAVLYRCESTLGCCPQPKTCSPSRYENVTITFKVQDMTTMQYTYPQHEFRNDTRCSCVNPTT